MCMCVGFLIKLQIFIYIKYEIYAQKYPIHMRSIKQRLSLKAISLLVSFTSRSYS